MSVRIRHALPRLCLAASLPHRATAQFPARNFQRTMATVQGGDLNNTSAARQTAQLEVDENYLNRSLAIPESEDDADVRKRYRPFLLSEDVANSDWISKLELSTVLKIAEADLQQTGGDRLKILVLYGSMRNRSYSKLLAYEASRILHRLGCDVRVYDPAGLPIKDDVQHDNPKVQELRSLSRWSDGHVWVSPEQHGNLTAVFKNQIDWIPLSTGSVRPTQGRTLALAQVSGGSQSFNTVNSLRVLGRWMRMFVIPNQSSVPMAYTQFTEERSDADGEGGSRMLKSGNRDRLVDCMEELVKVTCVVRERFAVWGDRFSEREERRAKERKAREEEERKGREEEERKAEEGKAKKVGDVLNGVDVEKI